MVALQILSKVLATKDLSIIENNSLTEEYFVGYEDEYNYIIDHFKQYGTVPDKATFLSKFEDVELVEVTESDTYLVDEVREEWLYYKCVPVVQQMANLLKTDANAAAQYMAQAIKDLQPNYRLGGVNIIAQAMQRYEQFEKRKEKQDEFFFTTGFEELDDTIHGLSRETAELVVIYARTNMGKSWVLAKICTHIWQIGFNVGYVSPEMSPENVGYRFDTLYKNFSNKGLMWSNDSIGEDYKQYIQDLSQRQNGFVVATPMNFDRKITVTKLKNWIKENNLNLVAIDGISYMTDERAKRGDNKSTTLTNIAEDLRLLSLEMKIPVLVVMQANRGGVKNTEEGAPELETMRDSDGVSHNATKAFSIRQLKDNVLELDVTKNTFGVVGAKLKYSWSIDTGEFVFIPSYDDGMSEEQTKERVKEVKKQYKGDKEDVF